MRVRALTFVAAIVVMCGTWPARGYAPVMAQGTHAQASMQNLALTPPDQLVQSGSGTFQIADTFHSKLEETETLAPYGTSHMLLIGTVTSATPKDPFAAQLTIDQSHRVQAGNKMLPSLTLNINPGSANEIAETTIVCHCWDRNRQLVDSTKISDSPADFYSAAWQEAGKSLAPASGGGYSVSDWTYVGQNGVLATKSVTYHHASSNPNQTEDVTLKLTLRYSDSSSP